MKKLFQLTLLFSVWLLVVLLDQWLFGLRAGWLNETIKSMVFVMGGLAVAEAFSPNFLLSLLKPIPWVLASYLLLYMAFNGFPLWDGRLSLEHGLGAYNTLGFMLALGLIILLVPQKDSMLISLEVVVFMFLSELLWLTYSRSAIFGLLGGIIYACFMTKKHQKLLVVYLSLFLFIFIFPFFEINKQLTYKHYTENQQVNNNLSRFNLFQDIKETGGSGRLMIWSTLIKNYWDTPIAWLTGFGPGWILNLKIFDKPYKSMDSFIIAMLYSYGIMGFIFSIWFLFKLATASWNSYDHLIYKSCFGFLLCFTSLVNDTVSASQLMFFGVLLVGFLLNKNTISVND